MLQGLAKPIEGLSYDVNSRLWSRYNLVPRVFLLSERKEAWVRDCGSSPVVPVAGEGVNWREAAVPDGNVPDA